MGRRCGSRPLTTHFLPRKVKRDSFSCGVSSRDPTSVILRGGGSGCCCWPQLLFRRRGREASAVSSCELDRLQLLQPAFDSSCAGSRTIQPRRGDAIQSNQAGADEVTRRKTCGRHAPANVEAGGARGHAPSGRDGAALSEAELPVAGRPRVLGSLLRCSRLAGPGREEVSAAKLPASLLRRTPLRCVSAHSVLPF